MMFDRQDLTMSPSLLPPTRLPDWLDEHINRELVHRYGGLHRLEDMAAEFGVDLDDDTDGKD